jgi:hypothetical protein
MKEGTRGKGKGENNEEVDGRKEQKAQDTEHSGEEETRGE